MTDARRALPGETVLGYIERVIMRRVPVPGRGAAEFLGRSYYVLEASYVFAPYLPTQVLLIKCITATF